MCDKMLDSICRLCLTENFTLINIFTNHSPSGEIVYQVLNYIYGLKICERDGLPSKICAPCFWRMIEFSTYKKNVKYAESEIKILLSRAKRKRSNKTKHNSKEVSREEANEYDVLGEEQNVVSEVPEDVVSEVPDDVVSEVPDDVVNETEVSMEPEINIVELKMPGDIHPENDILEYTESRINSSEYLGDKDYYSGNVCLKMGSSDVSSPGISNINEAHKEICEKGVRNDVVNTSESFLGIESNIGDNLAESDKYSSETPGRSNRKAYFCDICKRGFIFLSKLKYHIRVHYIDRPYKCKECGRTFKQYDVKRRHELRHLKPEMDSGRNEEKNANRRYYCEICNKQFTTRGSFHNHSNRHKKKYSCSFCGKSFGSNSYLNVHLRIHSNEKPYSCELCEKSFNEKSTLKRHMITHSDVRPFPCSLCSKRFKSHSAMCQHELTHLRSN